ncbi:MAG: FRG domain-containing protein [Pyrinomonadaceae bacterium]
MTSDWQTILQQVESLQEEARKQGYPLWYRGHRFAEWKLKTNLHRRIEDDFREIGRPIPENDKARILRDVYKSLYRKYKARAWHFLSFREMSDWGIIFSMQHHGVPTRLLDWTESFACAVYFAQYGRKPMDDAAVFILSPEHLNQANFGDAGQVALGENVSHGNVELTSYHPGYQVSDVPPLHTIAVAPILSNPRMLAQRSTFTLSGDPFQALEERYKDFIVKIILPASTNEDSRRFLNLVGIGHFGYFPDFEGLRNELIENMDKEVEAIKELFADGAI